LNYKGEIHAQGSYEELVTKGIDFVSLMATEGSSSETHQQQRRMSNLKKPEEIHSFTPKK
jgi:hypothetical protein